MTILKTEDGQPNGTAVIKFASQELVEEAIKKMNKFNVNGRQINVKPEIKLTTGKSEVNAKSGDAKIKPKSDSKPQQGKFGAKSQSGMLLKLKLIFVVS